MSRKLLLSPFGPLSVLALLAACGSGQDDYPRLLPTQAILAEPSLPDHAGPAATSGDPVKDAALARGSATRARADAIPDPLAGDDLNARAADLKRRAEALRRTDTAANMPVECPPDSEPGQCAPSDAPSPAE